MRFSYNNKVDSKKLDKIVNVLSSPFMNKIFNKSGSDLVSTLNLITIVRNIIVRLRTLTDN